MCLQKNRPLYVHLPRAQPNLGLLYPLFSMNQTVSYILAASPVLMGVEMVPTPLTTKAPTHLLLFIESCLLSS